MCTDGTSNADNHGKCILRICMSVSVCKSMCNLHKYATFTAYGCGHTTSIMMSISTFALRLPVTLHFCAVHVNASQRWCGNSCHGNSDDDIISQVGANETETMAMGGRKPRVKWPKKLRGNLLTFWQTVFKSYMVKWCSEKEGIDCDHSNQHVHHPGTWGHWPAFESTCTSPRSLRALTCSRRR